MRSSIKSVMYFNQNNMHKRFSSSEETKYHCKQKYGHKVNRPIYFLFSLYYQSLVQTIFPLKIMQISLDSTSIYYSNIQVHYLDDKNFQILYFRNIGAGIQLRLDSKKYILLSKQQKLLIFSFWNQMVNSVPRKDHAQQ